MKLSDIQMGVQVKLAEAIEKFCEGTKGEITMTARHMDWCEVRFGAADYEIRFSAAEAERMLRLIPGSRKV